MQSNFHTYIKKTPPFKRSLFDIVCVCFINFIKIYSYFIVLIKPKISLLKIDFWHNIQYVLSYFTALMSIFYSTGIILI